MPARQQQHRRFSRPTSPAPSPPPLCASKLLLLLLPFHLAGAAGLRVVRRRRPQLVYPRPSGEKHPREVGSQCVGRRLVAPGHLPPLLILGAQALGALHQRAVQLPDPRDLLVLRIQPLSRTGFRGREESPCQPLPPLRHFYSHLLRLSSPPD